ncbi:DUF2500 domain-containing protein [Bacillus sp. RG28]|uniref:DUF2500 domain-containing protein n=1 Tax=Gottfriedia endophytica TaxID=2820819 RepID=A0A940SIS6_9BACI|nr:DUF2500 domain-containing protein [Gottfriedia endophytica]MBP0725300.1 DUF2500 domain-containing protein [Gottfriedia endophytica]
MFENQGDLIFRIGPYFIGIIFVIILGTILTMIIKGISTWNKNNHQPRINTKAKVVTKRTSTSGGGETNVYHQYFVTFEFDSGDRVEFQVTGQEYGQLVEGDNGELEFQGTRYLGYTRTKHPNILN